MIAAHHLVSMKPTWSADYAIYVIRFWMTAGFGRGFLSSNRTATLAGSSTDSAMTAMTPTMMYDATIRSWCGAPL